MTGKFYTIISNPVQTAKRKDLIASAVGQYRPLPSGKPAQPAERFDDTGTLPKHHMVSVYQHNLRAGLF
jgi:hypothetical protein